MKIVVTGISGFVGSAIRRHFKNHDVRGLGIRPSTSDDAIREALKECDVLINLSGATIIGRWSESYKQTLYSSRIHTTQRLVKVMKTLNVPPKLLLNASAVGIYESDIAVDEHGALGYDFLSALCRDWEAEALQASHLGVRVAIMRFGVIYGKGGGAMSKMLTPFKLGVGGALGDGTQMVSWIHIDDLIRAMEHLITHETLSGVFNFTAPEPLSNARQTEIMGSVLHRPTFLGVPAFAVKLLFGEGATVMLDSKEVYPKALEASGFTFTYPDFESAFRAIVQE